MFVCLNCCNVCFQGDTNFQSIECDRGKPFPSSQVLFPFAIIEDQDRTGSIDPMSFGISG